MRWSLRCDAVCGGGAEWEQWRPPHLWLSIFHSATHNQTGPLWCWFPSGRAYAHSRPLWVSPTTSPVRLGVSPAAVPTPRGIFNQRFEALFPPVLEPWVARFASLPTVCPVYLWANVVPRDATRCSACPVLRHSEFICANVGLQGLLVLGLPAPFVPHSASLSPATATRVLSTPPTSLDECLFSISLVSVPLAVRFSVSSGCARRRSVST